MVIKNYLFQGLLRNEARQFEQIGGVVFVYHRGPIMIRPWEEELFTFQSLSIVFTSFRLPQASP